MADVWAAILSNGGADYAIGDSVILDLETIDGINCGSVRMMKVAEGEDGTDSTWLALDSLATAMDMNSTNTNKGGWEACKRRAWLNGAFFNGLPEILRNAIVATTRYTDSYDMDGNWVDDVPTLDHIWIPSLREVDNKEESKGTYYSEWRNATNNSFTLGHGGEKYRVWHRTVSASGTGYFRGTGSGGGSPGTGAGASALGGIAIGFSIKAVGGGSLDPKTMLMGWLAGRAVASQRK